MAKELLQHSAIFLASIREQDAALKVLPTARAPNWTLEQTIMDSPDLSQIHDAARSQPTCTAIQIALVQVMRSWGIAPSAVVGHSSGEIAAAYAAGLVRYSYSPSSEHISMQYCQYNSNTIKSLSEAILVSYLRGVAVNSVATEGGMIA